MALVGHTGTALLDEAAILNDLNTIAGARTALKFRLRFKALYDRLANHPAIGPRRRPLGANIRIGIVNPYIVIYRHTVADDAVMVLRVVDGRRNITRRMLAGIR